MSRPRASEYGFFAAERLFLSLSESAEYDLRNPLITV